MPGVLRVADFVGSTFTKAHESKLGRGNLGAIGEAVLEASLKSFSCSSRSLLSFRPVIDSGSSGFTHECGPLVQPV